MGRHFDYFVVGALVLFTVGCSVLIFLFVVSKIGMVYTLLSLLAFTMLPYLVGRVILNVNK